MIWYCYSFLFGFKCIFQLYSAEVFISYGYQYRVTLCICPLHPIPVYRTVLRVYAVLELSVIRCSFYYFLDRVAFHHTFHRYDYDCYWDFYGHSFYLNYTFRISVTKHFCFCKCLTPWMFPSPEILLEYCMFLLNFLMSCLSSLQGYPTGQSQALNVLAALGTLDWPLASCMLVYFLEI